MPTILTNTLSEGIRESRLVQVNGFDGTWVIHRTSDYTDKSDFLRKFNGKVKKNFGRKISNIFELRDLEIKRHVMAYNWCN